jgi:hypothetical protein
MRRTRRSAWAAGGTIAGLVLVAATPAGALDCRLPGGFFPTFYHEYDGTVLPRLLPADSLFVVECPVDPARPCLQPSLTLRGQEVALIEIDRRPVLGEGALSGAPAMERVRYAPSSRLSVGETYDVAAVRSVGERSAYWVGSVSVVDAGGDPPPLPVLRGLEYTSRQGFSGPVRAAGFAFDPIPGMLIADVGEPDEDPWQNVALFFAGQSADRQSHWLSYSLGVRDCYSNFPQADLGVTTQVRFGQMDAAGRFSGWTPFYVVSYPAVESVEQIPGELIALEGIAPQPGVEGDDGVPPDVEEITPQPGVEGDDGALTDVETTPEPSNLTSSSAGCSLSAPRAGAGSLPWLFALCALYASRRLSSAASGSTSSRSKRSSVAREPG